MDGSAGSRTVHMSCFCRRAEATHIALPEGLACGSRIRLTDLRNLLQGLVKTSVLIA